MKLNFKEAYTFPPIFFNIVKWSTFINLKVEYIARKPKRSLGVKYVYEIRRDNDLFYS